MSPVVLLVTWFVVGQPAHSYQVEFAHLPACNNALDGIKIDYDRFVQNWRLTGPVRTDPPHFLATCVVRR